MSVNLESVLKNIQSEKNTKLRPENIRKGVTALGIQGTLQPVTVQGGDVGLAIYLQNETPINPEGIWMNTNKTYDDIYIETEIHTTQHSHISSANTTDDDSNFIKGRTVPTNLSLSTYCQRGNKFHFFGHWTSGLNNTSSTLTLQHYSYDFDTNVWTKLSDCPVPQGGAAAEWTDDDTIYIIGNRHTNYYNYVYRYTISTDTWERLEDVPLSAWASAIITDSCYDQDNQIIYLRQSAYIFKYEVTNNSFSIVKAISASYNSGSYRHGIVFIPGYLFFTQGNNSNGIVPIYRLNLLTLSVDTLAGGSASAYPWGLMTLKKAGNRIYAPIYYDSNTSGTYLLAYCAITTSGTVTPSGITATSTDLPQGPRGSLPFGPIVTEDGTDAMLFFYGTSTSNMRALVLHDKTYNFENDTLLIYGNNVGSYETQMYLNSKIINGQRWCQRFSNVYLWDAGNQTMLKTLPLSYGNGTDWTQIR
jgi:hypothetical protein|nr:MAG TPA: Kelch repeat [Caudoviricetes sp.]